MPTDNDVDELVEAIAALKVTETVRKCKRLPLPPVELVVEFEKLACRTGNIRNGRSNKIKYRRLRAFFGVNPIVMAKCWELLVEEEPLPKGAKKVHLLEYRLESNFASHWGVDEKTYRKWVQFFLQEISNLTPIVIRWENRLTNDRGADCLVSVDGTDIPFQQILIDDPDRPGKKKINKALYSKKINGPALRYEVTVSLLSDDIVNIEGPFCPGDYNDLEIFRTSLLHMLRVAGERAEADNGYAGETPLYIKCPSSIANPVEKEGTQKRIAGRHENLNKRIKHWACLTQRFKGKGTMEEKCKKHANMFRSACVLTQLSLELGQGELYSIDDANEKYE